MKLSILLCVSIIVLSSCKKNENLSNCNDFSSAFSLIDTDGDGLTDCEETTGVDNPNTIRIPSSTTDPNIYDPTPKSLNIPPIFDLILPPLVPNNNPITVEGVALGRALFYEKRLSGDGSISCATCHNQAIAFTDDIRFSVGIDNIEGNRNAMPLFNLAWNFDEKFFWNGRSFSLENQALEPVENHIEMNNMWPLVVEELQNDALYPDMFLKAFKTDVINKELAAKAIAQFERTLISGQSKFDKYSLGETTLTADELEGFNIFMDESRGDCFHCHGSNNNPVWTDFKFHNNGLSLSNEDLGLQFTTGNPTDKGKFKTPSLRNLAYTAPYMHDGRFETLEEVIDHYSEGLVFSPTIDPLMKKIDEGGVHLTPEDKQKLKAFLLTLGDETFVNNVDFGDPN